MLYAWDNIYGEYNAVAHLYYSDNPSVLSYIVLLFVINNFLFCDSLIIILLREEVVSDSCLILPDKKEQNTIWRYTESDVNDELDWFEALKWFNEITSIDTD